MATRVGTGGGYAGAAAGSGLAAVFGTASVALLAAPIAVGAVAGGALGVSGYRAMYRAFFRKGEVALQGLLGAVAVEAEQAGPPRTLPSSD